MTKRRKERTVGFKSLFLGNMYVCVCTHTCYLARIPCVALWSVVPLKGAQMNHIQNSYCYVNHEKVN